jgi:hypothetical protein
MASFIQGIWGIRNEQTSGSNGQKPSFSKFGEISKKKDFSKTVYPR